MHRPLSFGLAYTHLQFHFPFLNFLPYHRATGAKILEGQFKFLNKQIILINVVAVTLCPLYWQLPRSCHLKDSSFTECFKKCHYWQHAQQLFNRADIYSLEHSGSLSCETCHFLGFCFLDDHLSCPKWIIPSHVAAWHTDSCLLLQLCLKTWFHMSLCLLSTHASWGDPASSEILRSCSNVMLSRHSSWRHACIRMLGFIASGPPHYWSPVAICY